MSKVDKQQLRELAEDVSLWGSSLSHAWPSDPDFNDAWTVGSIDEDGNEYPVIEVDADCYDAPGDSEKLARFAVAASPATVLALLDEIEALRKDAFPCLTGSVCGGDASLNTVNISSDELVKWSEVPLGTAVTVIIHRRDGGADRG